MVISLGSSIVATGLVINSKHKEHLSHPSLELDRQIDIYFYNIFVRVYSISKLQLQYKNVFINTVYERSTEFSDLQQKTVLHSHVVYTRMYIYIDRYIDIYIKEIYKDLV